MADNTVLSSGSGGDTIRDVAKSVNSPAKTPICIIDIGGNTDGATEVALEQATYSSGTASQPANGAYAPVLAAKDSGRTYKIFYIDAAAGATTETLETMTINSGGTTSSATSYTVTSGKTLRLQSFTVTVKGSSTAAAVNGRVRVRSAATVATTSPIVIALDSPGTADTSAAGNGTQVDIEIPDGLEIAGGQEIGISEIVSTTSSTVSCCLIGYEY